MKEKLTIAIDPGASGGIVWGNSEWCQAQKMPDTLGDLVELIEEIDDGYEVNVYLEKVGGFAGEAMPGSRMFNFGEGYGQIQGVISAFGMPLHFVTPQRWIKAQHLGTRGKMTKTQWKNKLKSQAQMLYPQHKIILATADAFLIFHSAINGNI